MRFESFKLHDIKKWQSEKNKKFKRTFEFSIKTLCRK